MSKTGRRALGLVVAVGCLAGLVFSEPGPQGASARAKELDASSAEALDEKLKTIRQRHAEGASGQKRYDVTEDEANAYLLYRLSEHLPEEVTDPWVRFSPDRVEGGAMLDVKLLQAHLGESALAKYLEGEVPVEVLASVRAEAGVGQVELESVTLAGVPLPKTLIDKLMSDASQNPALPEGVRLNEVFPLPYGLTSARVRTGRLILRQGGTEGDAQANLTPPAQ